jgi:hypothetical protein
MYSKYGTASLFAAMVMVLMVVRRMGRVLMVWEGPTVVSMVMVWVGEGWRVVVVSMVTMVTVAMVMVVKQVVSFVMYYVGLVPQVSRSTKVTMLRLLLCVCVCVCV